MKVQFSGNVTKAHVLFFSLLKSGLAGHQYKEFHIPKQRYGTNLHTTVQQQLTRKSWRAHFTCASTTTKCVYKTARPSLGRAAATIFKR